MGLSNGRGPGYVVAAAYHRDAVLGGVEVHVGDRVTETAHGRSCRVIGLEPERGRAVVVFRDGRVDRLPFDGLKPAAGSDDAGRRR